MLILKAVALRELYIKRVIYSYLYIIDLKTPPIPYQLSLRQPYTADDILTLTLYTLIFTSGTIGNAVVIKSFLRAPDQPGSRFVIGLGVVDFISSIFTPFGNIMFTIYDHKHWPLGKVGCLMYSSWSDSFQGASSWLLVAISLERAR